MWNNARILRRVSSWLYAAVALLLIASAAVWLYRSSYFPVKQINIDGRLRYTDAGELQQVAQQYIRGNIFRADLNGAQAAFVKLPWIAKAEVRRRLPDTVDIRLTERIPVAHWDEGRLLDSEGNPFAAEWEGDEELPEFKGQEGSGKIMAEHLDVFRRRTGQTELGIAVLAYTPPLRLGNRAGQRHPHPAGARTRSRTACPLRSSVAAAAEPAGRAARIRGHALQRRFRRQTERKRNAAN